MQVWGRQTPFSDLREEIAIAAMTALIREGFYTRSMPLEDARPRCHERLARMAYDLAEAMLQARREHADELFGDARARQLH